MRKEDLKSYCLQLINDYLEYESQAEDILDVKLKDTDDDNGIIGEHWVVDFNDCEGINRSCLVRKDAVEALSKPKVILL